METSLEFDTRVHHILDQTKFQDWKWGVKYEGRRLHIRVVSDGKCNVTGEPMNWNGRWWPLSEHMTDGEVVQTAFKAVMTAMEHEVREQFTYKGVTVFDPHYDIDKLVELRRQPDALKERAPAA